MPNPAPRSSIARARLLLAAALLAAAGGCALPGGPLLGTAPVATPGEFREGTHTAQGVTRGYRLYVPARNSGRRRPLVVMLHGCAQSAADLARATRMNAYADRGGFLVLYPEQSVDAHPDRCWRWYERAQAAWDSGEAAFVAALTSHVMRTERVSRDRVYLAGFSAGAAMGQAVVVNQPELFAAAALHSTVPWGVASDRLAAEGVMRAGVSDPALGTALAERMRAVPVPVPVLVLQGRQDAVSAAANGLATAQQWAWLAGAKLGGDPAEYVASATWMQFPADSALLRAVEACWGAPGGDCLVRYIEVDALVHAWSGGDAGARFTDPRTPSATVLVLRFFDRWRR